jgi:hypothetical protein
MFQRHASRRRTRMGAAAAVFVVCAAIARAATADDPPGATLFRVFLTNGTTVTSYGEYARVGDRVVFSMPVGGGAEGPRLHLVTLPASLVDWAQTERYADSARYTRYVETRGEADYVALNNQIAQALVQISGTREPARRLEIAMAARRLLVEWPSAHYGYRAPDIAQMSGILDEVISELRAETGATAFELSFVATVSPPALLPASAVSTERELVYQALGLARIVDGPSERLSLLESIAAALDPGTTPPESIESWKVSLREMITTEIAEDRKVDAAYAVVSRDLTKLAARYSRLGDVMGVQRVLNSVDRRDRQLGKKRPEQIGALVGALNAELEQAQRMRLLWDRWALRLPDLRKYAMVAGDLLQSFDASRGRLEEIERLAGPSDAILARLLHTCDTLSSSLRALTPPAELTSAHALVLNAIQLASTAAQVRREAIRAGNLDTARNAASAATGALMLMARARAEIDAQLKPPSGGQP